MLNLENELNSSRLDSCKLIGLFLLFLIFLLLIIVVYWRKKNQELKKIANELGPLSDELDPLTLYIIIIK